MICAQVLFLEKSNIIGLNIVLAYMLKFGMTKHTCLVFHCITVKMQSSSLYSGKPILPTVHITPWITEPISFLHSLQSSSGTTMSLLYQAHVASFLFYGLNQQTRQLLIWSMRNQGQVPKPTDLPAWDSNPIPLDQHSTKSPL